MSLVTSHHGTAAALAAAVLLGGLALTGCSAGHPVKKVSRPVAGKHLPAGIPVAGGKGTVGAFIAKLQARPARSFEAEYLGGGKRSGLITYAFRPPDALLFGADTLQRGKDRRTRILVNGSGDYRCVQRGTRHAPWTCQQLTEASAAAQIGDFAVYTTAHWVTYLKAALAAGATATTFTSRVYAPPTFGNRARGDPMGCLSFRTAGTGSSMICAAAPGSLGPVILCKGSTSFLLERYITSPPASLFQLPPGAKVIGQGAQQPRAA